MEQIDVNFANGSELLAGSIVKPLDQESCNSVVFVHGSGPETRSSGRTPVAYRDHLVSRGYAVLAYDKPGTGESTGDWRRQKLEERAIEVASAVSFLESRPFARRGRVGLIGWSQAGWVMPVVPQLLASTAFIVSISGAAVTPLEQEVYRVESQLRRDGFSQVEVARAVGAYSRIAEMARDGVDAERVLASFGAAQRENWFGYLGFDTPETLAFVMLNLRFDPLPHLRRVRCPFLGIWGDLDTFVPVSRSMQLTRDALAAAGNTSFTLELVHGADHRMRLEPSGPDEAEGPIVPGLLDRVSGWLDATLSPPAVN